MNIKDWELTEAERAALLRPDPDTILEPEGFSQRVAAAQHAKDLWGVRDMLFVAIKECDLLDQHPAAIAIRNLDYYMSEAGIPRPGGVSDEPNS